MKKRVPSSKTFIRFNDPCSFIGMEITKGAVVSSCIKVSEVFKKNGNKTKILHWLCTHENGHIFERTTSAENFRISDVPSLLPKDF